MHKGIKARFGRIWNVEALPQQDVSASTEALRIRESGESEDRGIGGMLLLGSRRSCRALVEVCRSWVAVVVRGDGATVKPDTPTSGGVGGFYLQIVLLC